MKRLAAAVLTTAALVAGGAVLGQPALGATTSGHTVRSAPAQFGDAEEQAFVARINALRASQGLGQLRVDGELTTQARSWAQTMKDAGSIFHSSGLSAGITADWQKLGENVGVGGTVDALFDAFVASEKHYENLIDPLYTSVGIGVVWADGTMYTAHRFMAVFPPTEPPPAPPTKPAKATPPAAAPAPPSPVAPESASAPPPQELASADPVAPPAAAEAPQPAAPPPPGIPERIDLVLDALEAFAR